MLRQRNDIDLPHGERDLIAALTTRLSEQLGSAPDGEVWAGDDAAVLVGGASPLVFSTDLIAEHVHFERSLSGLFDIGWKALSVNVSDVAAMGARPVAAVVAVAGAKSDEFDVLYEGLLQASTHYRCPVVGGDVSGATSLVVSIAIIGSTDGAKPILRSGGLPGDLLFVTGPLGKSAAGLRLLKKDATATGPLVDAHRRPIARHLEGQAALLGGAHAMIDLSDGLGIDLCRLASASRVGFELEDVPIADGATTEEALGGGEDYELVFSASDEGAIRAAFSKLGCAAPTRIGYLVADGGVHRWDDRPIDAYGFEHRFL